MEENEDNLLELDYDSECYHSTWDIIGLWYKRALRLQRLKKEQDN